MREWQKKAIAGVASTACSLLLLEIVLHLAWQPGGQQSVIMAHPEYGWALRPGSRMYSVDTERGLHYHIRVNDLGQRDVEHERRPPADRKRVLLLGDSFIFGAGIETGRRCSELLQDEFGAGVEIVNAGVSGWGTDQEYLYFRREGLALQPDVVVLGFVALNDVLNDMLPHELFGSAPKPRFELDAARRLVLQPPAARPVPTPRQRAVQVLKHSRALHFFGRHTKAMWARLEVRSHAATPVPAPFYPEDFETDTSHWSVYRAPYTPRFEAAFQVTEALVTAMRDSCRARGLPFLLLAWPQKVEVDEAARRHELDYYGYDARLFDFDAPYARLRALAARLDVPLVYPRDLFQDEARHTPLFFAHDGHPNAAGHALAAHALVPVLRDALEHAEDAPRAVHR